jgi:thiol-disulfide isomerase/thioredoxin
MLKRIKQTTKLAVTLLVLTIVIACNTAESKTTLQGTIAENYPLLSSSTLASANLAKLPKDVLIRSGSIEVKRQELEQEMATAPDNIKEQLQNNAFFILEQKFTEKVLVEESRSALAKQGQDVDNLSDRDVIQSFMMDMVKDVEPTEAEMTEFYAANKELMGEMTYEAVKGQIAGFLRQQKQQEIVQDYVTGILTKREVEISESWAQEKLSLAMNNDVDQARQSGKPTLVNFGSDSCVPCQMMIPAREAVKELYKDRANVVYVHTDREQILSTRYGIQSIPTLIFFDHEGQEVHNHVGMMSQEEMEEWMNKMVEN